MPAAGSLPTALTPLPRERALQRMPAWTGRNRATSPFVDRPALAAATHSRPCPDRLGHAVGISAKRHVRAWHDHIRAARRRIKRRKTADPAELRWHEGHSI